MNGMSPTETGAAVASCVAVVGIVLRLWGVGSFVPKPEPPATVYTNPPRRRLPALALWLALAGWVTALALIAPATLRDRPLVLVGGLLAAVMVGAGLARTLRPEHLLAAGALALPLRIPVPLGDETYNLLLPLYAVIGIATMMLLIQYRGMSNLQLGRARTVGSRLLDGSITALLALGAGSLFWTDDVATGTIEVTLFLVPFALLYVIVRTIVAFPFVHIGQRVAVAFVGVMSAAALVGLYQRGTHTIWQNTKVLTANAYTPNFRTNSIFWDPNIYGRYLVLALLALLAGLLVAHRIPVFKLIGGAVLGALLMTGLWHSYSQSSWLALAAGCIMLALLCLRRNERLALGIVAAVLIASVPAIADHSGGFEEQGRLSVASRGLELASEHPVRGIGTGGFELAYLELAKREDGQVGRLRASHTTPITVIAEWGVPGLLMYLSLLVGIILAAPCVARDLVGAYRTSLTPWALAAAIALVVHSLFYAGFFEDPAIWVVLAVLSARTLAPDRTAHPDGPDPDEGAGVREPRATPPTTIQAGASIETPAQY